MFKEINAMDIAKHHVLLCCNNEMLMYTLKKTLMKHFDVDTHFVVDISNETELKQSINNAQCMPLLGTNWLLLVDTEKITYDTLLKYITVSDQYCVFVYITSKYMDFKRFIDSKYYKALDKDVENFYCGKFRYDDINWLYKETFNECTKETQTDLKKGLPDNLLDFLCKHYQRDIDKVFLFLDRLKTGVYPQKQTELINLIGLGGLTSATLVFDLLKAEPKTATQLKNTVKRFVVCLKDLNTRKTYREIYIEMYNAVQRIYDYKVLRLNGYITATDYNIPPGFDEKFIKQLHIHEKMIDNHIPLYRLLELRNCFTIKQSAKGYFAYIPDCEEVLLELCTKYLSVWEKYYCRQP